MTLSYNIYFSLVEPRKSNILENLSKYFSIKINTRTNNYLSGFNPDGAFTLAYKDQRLLINLTEDVTDEELKKIDESLSHLLNEVKACKGYSITKNFRNQCTQNYKIFEENLHG